MLIALSCSALHIESASSVLVSSSVLLLVKTEIDNFRRKSNYSAVFSL